MDHTTIESTGACSGLTLGNTLLSYGAGKVGRAVLTFAAQGDAPLHHRSTRDVHTRPITVRLCWLMMHGSVRVLRLSG